MALGEEEKKKEKKNWRVRLFTLHFTHANTRIDGNLASHSQVIFLQTGLHIILQ